MTFYFVDCYKNGESCWVEAGPFINLEMAQSCKDYLDKTQPCSTSCSTSCAWKVVEREFLVTRVESCE